MARSSRHRGIYWEYIHNAGSSQARLHPPRHQPVGNMKALKKRARRVDVQPPDACLANSWPAADTKRQQPLILDASEQAPVSFGIFPQAGQAGREHLPHATHGQRPSPFGAANTGSGKQSAVWQAKPRAISSSLRPRSCGAVFAPSISQRRMRERAPPCRRCGNLGRHPGRLSVMLVLAVVQMNSYRERRQGDCANNKDISQLLHQSLSFSRR